LAIPGRLELPTFGLGSSGYEANIRDLASQDLSTWRQENKDLAHLCQTLPTFEKDMPKEKPPLRLDPGTAAKSV
jgi:hypothetical protein